MDLRSYYLSRFLFLIIWSIVTDMKCQSHAGLMPLLSVSILRTYGLKLEEFFELTALQKQQNCVIMLFGLFSFSLWFIHPFTNRTSAPCEAFAYMDIGIIFMHWETHF